MSRGRLAIGAIALCALCCALWLANKHAVADQPPDAETNPYLAAEGLSTAELCEYIERMLRKPETIRNRPGFGEAVIDATDRVLAAKPEQAQETLALLARFDTLNHLAVRGDDKANASLVALAEKYLDDSREKIAIKAKLHTLEHRAHCAEELAEEEIPKLLTEMKEYLAGQTLGPQHLRLASNVVRAINMLPEGDTREKYFHDFGGLLARSSDKKLAKYGRDIARIKQNDSELVGQSLEIEGATVDRLVFDWNSYRGKVVLVDFWATWCGPCRAELPNVKENYTKYHSKGFEVVAISLDSDRETLENFIAENDLPWVNLFDDNSNGWDNPIATKYSIKSIPRAILVGKDGKVITTSARGAALGQHLEKLLGAAK